MSFPPPKHLPVPPIVGAFRVFLIVNIIISHQKVLPFQLVLVVVIHVGTESKAEKNKEHTQKINKSIKVEL